MYKGFDDLTKGPDYIAYEAYLKNPGRDNVILKKPNQNDNSVKTAFWTLSGRVEAYSYTMMEEYEMRYYNNIDDSVNLVNGKIVTKATPAGKEGNGRYVYAIPMYIPIVEGRHHDDKAEPHPDPLGIKNSYPLSFHTWHIIYRSHSTFNSSPLTNEVKYYKRDAQGNPAFLKRSLTNVNAGADHWDVKSTDTQAPQVWHDDVYETVWLNP